MADTRCGRPMRRRAAAVVMLLAVTAGTGPAATAQTVVDTSPNVMKLTVKGLSKSFQNRDGSFGLATAFNRMVVTLKICVPGTRHCTAVDNVMVDTGSVGLRLQDGVLSGLPLPDKIVRGRKLAECFGFVSSNIWGGVERADVYVGGLVVANMSLQVADRQLARPASGLCTTASSVPASNGTLGIGWGTNETGQYYGCENGSCSLLSSPLPIGTRLLNPVAALPTDNNGEIFELPPARSSPATSVEGRLIFGVNTRPNNQIAASTDHLLQLDENGHFTTSYTDGRTLVSYTYAKTYIDSGTQLSGFFEPTFQTCRDKADYYCVSNPLDVVRHVEVLGGKDTPPFKTELRVSALPGPATIVATGVYDDLVYRSSASQPDSFAWGLPFFLEKRVALVQQARSATGIPFTGPFYAFRDYEGPAP